ncbi:MAG: DUF934 domain-containing protein [Polyangiaceae bacterium]
MRIIKDRQIAEDTWLHLDDETALPDSGDVTLSLERLRRDSGALGARKGRLGVRLRSEQLAADVGDLLEHLALVCVEFPKFTDGRGYTTGRLLRDRHGYTRELRATGHVLQDQLYYLARCGYNSFALAPGKSLERALDGFEDFSVSYQAAADSREPIFRRVTR